MPFLYSIYFVMDPNRSTIPYT